jgi:hypothetical protein
MVYLIGCIVYRVQCVSARVLAAYSLQPVAFLRMQEGKKCKPKATTKNKSRLRLVEPPTCGTWHLALEKRARPAFKKRFKAPLDP